MRSGRLALSVEDAAATGAREVAAGGKRGALRKGATRVASDEHGGDGAEDDEDESPELDTNE